MRCLQTSTSTSTKRKASEISGSGAADVRDRRLLRAVSELLDNKLEPIHAKLATVDTELKALGTQVKAQGAQVKALGTQVKALKTVIGEFAPKLNMAVDFTGCKYQTRVLLNSLADAWTLFGPPLSSDLVAELHRLVAGASAVSNPGVWFNSSQSYVDVLTFMGLSTESKKSEIDFVGKCATPGPHGPTTIIVIAEAKFAESKTSLQKARLQLERVICFALLVEEVRRNGTKRLAAEGVLAIAFECPFRFEIACAVWREATATQFPIRVGRFTNAEILISLQQ
jgi:hypothetical protein